MSSFASTLVGITRSKLHLAVGGGSKDTSSLHRWVLLKNSIVRSQPSSPATAEPASLEADVQHVYRQPPVNEEEEVCDEEDGFVFPDPDAILDLTSSSNANASEAQWLDSLLETLSDDVDRDSDSDSDVTIMDHDVMYAPSLSPLSSSEDLVNTPAYYEPPSVVVPYPVPYPPQIIHEELRCRLQNDDVFTSIANVLPYYDVDDLDDLSVPEAIEDTSDDESETLATPSRSTSSFVEPISLAANERRRVYINPDPSYMYHFDLNSYDPLPFADSSPEYGPVYQEC